MKLHGYWRSSASWRVRIALEWKGLGYEYLPVHLVRDGGQQHVEVYRAKNPMRQVPLLELGEGRTLTQSMAILEYLEEVHPTPPLLPEDPFLRAKARQIAEIFNSGVQPLQNLSTLQAIQALGGDSKAWVQEWMERGLAAVELELSRHAGTFCVGDQPTFADVCLVPQLYGARRFEVDLAPYPHATRIEAACAALPAFQRAHADAQPDAT